MKVTAFNLSSGATVLADVNHETDYEFIVRFPLELLTTYDVDGSTQMSFTRWLPFNELDDLVVVYKSCIESATPVSETFQGFYKRHVKKYRDLVEQIAKEDAQEKAEASSPTTRKVIH